MQRTETNTFAGLEPFVHLTSRPRGPEYTGETL
jgi:hypothetical protein